MAIGEIYSDIHHTITKDAQGAIRRAINVDAVVGAVHNILRTRYGERVMLPEFGSGVHEVVFEGINQKTFSKLSEEITNAITKWDNRVIINSIKCVAKADQNEVTVQIFFSVAGFDDIFEANVNLMGGTQ